MTATSLTNTDFLEIKKSLTDYLDSQKIWTDYKWTGSNLNIILDLISYQAQLCNYTANMLANEAFLSSATLRNNIVAHAKTIGYTPHSVSAAKATVDFEFSLDENLYKNGFPRYLEILAGPAFSVSNAGEGYLFNVLENQISAVSSTTVNAENSTTAATCTFKNVEIYEGIYLKYEFVVNSSIYNQRFILDNTTIDINTLKIDVQEDPNIDYVNSYFRAENFVELNQDSRVFWIEEIDENRYELTFGDGFFGRKLQNGAKIYCNYLKSSGEVGNGIYGSNVYTFIGTIFDNTGQRVTIRPRVTNEPISDGGSELESAASIRFRAPKFYASQKRCVTTDDYESMIRKIYPSVDDIYCFGGETLPIPEYGRVYIIIKPVSGQKISNSTKNYIQKSLNNFRIASLDIKIMDPEIVYVECVSTVYYDDRKTTKDPSSIVSIVKNTLTNYAESDTVNKFGGAIRFSRLLGAIDDSDYSITRNNTTLRMRRDLKTLINTNSSYEICFQNEFSNDLVTNTMWSSGFQLEKNGIVDSKMYYMEDNRRGKIYTFYFDVDGTKHIDNKNFGTINYKTGEILLGYNKPIKFLNTEIPNGVIEIRSMPLSQDIIANHNVYMELDIGRSDIVAIIDKEFLPE